MSAISGFRLLNVKLPHALPSFTFAAIIMLCPAPITTRSGFKDTLVGAGFT